MHDDASGRLRPERADAALAIAPLHVASVGTPPPGPRVDERRGRAILGLQRRDLTAQPDATDAAERATRRLERSGDRSTHLKKEPDRELDERVRRDHRARRGD